MTGEIMNLLMYIWMCIWCGERNTNYTFVANQWLYSRTLLQVSITLYYRTHVMPLHLRFSRLTFSFNPLALLAYQPDPYGHKKHVPKNIIEFRKKFLLMLLYVVHFWQAYLKSHVGHRDETLHRHRNSWQVVQEHIIMSITTTTTNIPRHCHI